MRFKQTRRLMRFAFVNDAALTDKFVIERFSGSEYLSRDFSFDLELLSDDPNVALEDVQGRMVVVSLVRTDGSLRPFTGIVQRFVYVDSDMTGVHSYQAHIVPWLSYAHLRRDCRLFLDQNREQQLATLLEPYRDVADWQWKVTGELRQHTMCTQFNETDHNYLSYRLESDGYVTHFHHRDDGHTWTIHADTLNADPIDGPGPDVRFHADNGISSSQDSITRWTRHREWGASSIALSGYDFKKPTPALVSLPTLDRQAHLLALESHEFTGNYGYLNAADADRLARLRMEEIEVRAQLYEGHSTNPYLSVNRWFRLAGTPGGRIDAIGSDFVVNQIHHEGQNNYRQGADQPAFYRNRFVCHPRQTPWRPGRGWNSTPTCVSTPQTATISGRGGIGAIDVDEYGRVLLRFHWDRDGRSTCRARLMTAAGGGEHGLAGYPRIGSEAVVIFESGNPDHPIVTGLVANPERMPPWKLPEQANLSGLRSRENAGNSGNRPGGRSNHLVLDDTPERLQVQARSDHQASQLSLGHITRIEDTRGRQDARGQGYELRTDGHGAHRAALGLLTSTDGRPNAQGHLTDLREPLQRLTQAQNLHDSLSQAAQTAKAHDGSDQAPVVAALNQQANELQGTGGNPAQGEFPEFSAPHILTSSAAGIQSTAERSTHIASNEHTAMTSGGHTSIATGKSLLASVKERIRLFAYQAGMKLVAASGDIDITTLKDSINLLAKLNITQTADTITLSAKTRLIVSGGGSGTVWEAGGIRSSTAGTWTEHAASFAMNGPQAMGTPGLPQAAPLPLGQLDLLNQYINTGTGRLPQGVRQGQFKVLDAEGGTHAGSLDSQGFQSVAQVPMGMAEVSYERDPRDPWEGGSYLGENTWPAGAKAEAASALPDGQTADTAHGIDEHSVSAPDSAASAPDSVVSALTPADLVHHAEAAQQALQVAQVVQHGGPQAVAQATQLAAGQLTRQTPSALTTPVIPTQPTAEDLVPFDLTR